MGKKNKQFWIFLGIVVALIFIANSGFSPFSIATFSISNVDVVNNGQKILIYGRIGGGQELDITFSPSTLNSYLEAEGYTATKTSRLKATFIESKKEFRFPTSGGTTVKRISTTPSGHYLAIVGSVDGCKNKGFSNTVYVKNPIPLRHDCYEYVVEGDVTGFTGGETNKFNIEFDLDGVKSYLTNDAKSVVLANGKGRIDFQGFLGEVNTITAPGGYAVYHVGNNWRLVSSNAVSNLNSAFSEFKSCAGSASFGTLLTPNFNNCLSQYNQVLNANTASKNSQYLGTESDVNTLSFASGVMSANLRNPTLSPTFTIELDASKVGIVKLSGNPDIVSCINDQTLNSAGSTTGTARVKNIGDQEGFFDFSVACNNPQMQGSVNSQDISAGQTKSISVHVSGGNTGTNTNSGQCTFTVKDRNSDKSDSCTFDVDVLYNPVMGECVATETKCSPDGQTLFTCNNEQFQPTLCRTSEVCSIVGADALCVVKPGAEICTDNIDNDGDTRIDSDDPDCLQREAGDCKWYNVFCHIKNLFSGIFDFITIVRYILVYGISIVSIFVTFDWLGRIDVLREKNKKVIRWAMSIALGAGTFFALYRLILSPSFWTLAIISVGSIIVTSLIKGYLPKIPGRK